MLKCLVAAAVGVATVSGVCFGGTLVVRLDREYSGAAAPAQAESTLWARATFTDQSAGSVRLVLECLLADSNEFMAKAAGGAKNPQGWTFNLDPRLNPRALLFVHQSGVAASAIRAGSDRFAAGPDKFFDLALQFGAGLRGGDVSVYTISIAGGGLRASSFDFRSDAGQAGQSGNHSAVHVQGIASPSAGAGSSGWLGGNGDQPPVVPLPSAGSLGIAGIALLGVGRRRRAAR